MRSLNATVSPLLLRTIDEVGQKAGLSHEGLAQAVSDLSRIFTKERASVSRMYLDEPTYAAAYVNYFLPVNLSKIQVLLDEMPALDTNKHLSVLDLGSGPGTGALALLDWLHQRHDTLTGNLTVVAADSSASALRKAEQLWDCYCRESGVTSARLTPCEVDMERSLDGPSMSQIRKGGPYDLIIIANCLNEVFLKSKDPIGARTEMVAGLLELLAQDGTIMLVEPALRTTSRALQQVRDRLVQEKRCTIYSPCLHEHDCPALVNPFDWCHEERAWEPPAVIQEIDDEVGFIKDALKFSYLLVRKDGKTIIERRSDVFRVVSELRVMKGEKRVWLCNELGRQEVGRQDRLASPENAAVDAWHRGAIVQIERIVHKEKDGKRSALGRIERDAAVKIIRPV